MADIHANSSAKKDADFDARHVDDNHPYDGSGMAQRQCTDLPCLVIFIMYLCGMGLVTRYAMQNGEPRRLTHGFNYRGELCGVDVPVLSKPLLYWCGAGGVRDDGHPEKLDTKFPVCVEECPKAFSTEMACLGVEQVQVEKSGAEPYITQKTIITQSLVKQMSYPTMEFAGMYCVPHFIKQHILGKDSLTMQLMSDEGPIGNSWYRVAAAFGGLRRCWMVLAGAIPFSVVVCYTYLFILRALAYPAIIVSIMGVILAIVALGVYFIVGEFLSGEMLDSYREHNVLYQMFDLHYAAWTSKGLGVALLVLACLVSCGLAAMRKSLQIAVGCVQAACECIFSMPTLIIQPCLEAICKILIYGILMSGLTLLLSTATMEPDMMSVKGEIVGGLTRKFTFSNEQRLMVLFYCFGIAWLIELANSVSQFVVSYAVILWYYSPKPKGFGGPTVPLLRGLIVGIFFHLGTFAIGSFLITTLRVIRIVFTWLARQAKENGNQCAALIAGCCACCINCVQRYIEFITKNAYIDVALSSTSFLTAAQNAHGFIVSDTGKVALLSGSLFIVSVGVVAGTGTLTAALTWLLVTTNDRWTNPDSAHYVENPYFVAGLTAFIGGSVALCFMVVFDHCADTLLYTFLWNKSHGHNTVAKYAPDSLLSLMEYKKIENSGGGSARPAQSGIFSSFFKPADSARAEESQGLLR
eukprot:TRINITY_DN60935_c0_g1_i1.p1 TRINITY_DN60935_c0_g1~~TRINITY_DN60935_c0_g1_i1.p1  ORF type:complete len:712 (+),score=136.69 TRINITY_DN60935_c0_g1_i1:57-2138(+)